MEKKEKNEKNNPSITLSRNLSFDILRVGAIFYIVAYWHLFGYSEAFGHHSRLAELVTFCVLGLFCFLSGMLLSRRYSISTGNDVLRFYSKRILRIYPMYFMALNAFLLIGYIDLRTYIKSLFMANMILNQDLLTLWFVTMIFIFYLITPVYLRSYTTRKVVIFTAMAYTLLVFLHIQTGRIDLRLPQYLPMYALGIITARYSAMGDFLNHRAVVFVAFLFFLSAAWGFVHIDANLPRILVADLAMISLLPLLLKIGGLLSPLLNRGLIEQLSYASFAMYLFHRIVFKIGVMVFQPFSLSVSILYLVGLLLPITVILSYGLQKLYDRFLEKNIFFESAF